jgi:hypothetical protein
VGRQARVAAVEAGDGEPLGGEWWWSANSCMKPTGGASCSRSAPAERAGRRGRGSPASPRPGSTSCAGPSRCVPGQAAAAHHHRQDAAVRSKPDRGLVFTHAELPNADDSVVLSLRSRRTGRWRADPADAAALRRIRPPMGNGHLRGEQGQLRRPDLVQRQHRRNLRPGLRSPRDQRRPPDHVGLRDARAAGRPGDQLINKSSSALADTAVLSHSPL